jgi:ATP-dependent Clp protease ATP-binding subunit ClpC
VLPLHLFAAARETRALRLLCQRLAISQEVLLVKLQNLLALQPVHAETQEPRCTQHLYAALLAAGLECFRERRSSITVTELLIGCTDVDPDLQELFLSLDIQLEVLRHVGRWMHFSECYRRQWKEIRTLASQKPRSHMNRALTARPTPLLDVLGTDYTQIARRGGFPHLVARERELREVLRTLQSHLGNILLVGEPGTGKSEILKGIANLMAAEDVPPHLVDQRLVVLDPGALIGGSEGVGGVEGLSRRVLEEITKAGNILLGIEDIHHLLGAGSMRSSEDAGHMLMNALSEKKIRVIATTTTQEYARYLQPVETFLRRFQVIRIEEMDFLDTLTVLEARASGIEAKYEVQLSFPCLQACYELSLRLLSERYFPDKAIQILEESAALAREKRSKHTTVTKEDVAGVISRKTNVAVTSITEPEAARLLKLEEAMHERIIGQEEAVRAIASALRRARTGLRSPHRPIACLLFLGPTGVGKTATAKTIAKVYFGSENTMTRLDMSEYQTVESAERLLGHTGQTSPFLNTIRRNPHRLLLLDEFEKAHPDIMNLFLQLFDDGRLTDGSGHTVDFTHTLVIASSNAGSSRIEAALRRGETHEQVQRTLLQEELPKIFSPELLNRFDHTIIFEPLSHEHILKIAEQMVQTLSETLAEKGIQLIITPPALRELVRRGHDRRYGARPLRRTIQDTLEDPISQVILRGEVTRRDTIIVEEGGKIEVRKARVL